MTDFTMEKCPRCGGETEADEVDVGPGVIQGPRGCPACFWVEGDPSFIPGRSCKECRYVGTHTRKKIISKTGFGDQLMFENADKDETVYTCRAFELTAVLGERVGGVRDVTEPGDEGMRFEQTFETRVTGERALCEHAGKEIGLVPITCAAWASAPPAVARTKRLAELDAMIAAREARAAAKERE